VCTNLVQLIFMIPLGTSYAASAFTGYFLGQMKIDKAKKYSRLTILLNVLATIVIIILLLAFHDQVAALFTSDPGTVEVVNKVLYMMTLYVFFDTIHGVQTGIIRGLGLQVIGSIYTLIVQYLIGLPLVLTFAFAMDMGVVGLWLGFSLACIILDAGYLVICECPDWHQISIKMQATIDKDKQRSREKDE